MADLSSICHGCWLLQQTFLFYFLYTRPSLCVHKRFGSGSNLKAWKDFYLLFAVGQIYWINCLWGSFGVSIRLQMSFKKINVLKDSYINYMT